MLTPIIFEGDSLVTPKDKEEQLHGVKDLKEFNVFKEEHSTGQSIKPATLEEDKLIPKSFKSYSPPETPLPMMHHSNRIDDKEDSPTTLAFKDMLKLDKQEIILDEEDRNKQ